MSEEANRAELPPDRITTLWRRLKDHRIAQWTVGYVAVAYGVQHAVTLTSEAYEWPNVVVRLSMTLLVLGLPVAMTLAWYHGDRVTRRVSGGEAAIVSLLLVLISLVFYVFVRPTEQTRPIAAAQEASVTAARAAAASPKGAISVAVLPFLNLSSDKEQEFFSDGMTEEITAALAKVPDLRVVARTSAFEFKGKNVNIRTMGEQLGATHLIEGSVRKAGNRLRITAQLIKADDGTHIWAEDYDRDLTDVFAIQEDIARAITASLHMTLGLKPGENLVNNREIDPESHEQFLRAKALLDARGIENVTEGAAVLERVTARNPAYAPAWAQLAVQYYLAGNYHAGNITETLAASQKSIDELRAKGEDAARRSVQLDPNLAWGHGALALFAFSRGKAVEWDELSQKALSLDPDNADLLTGYGIRLGVVGRLNAALTAMERAHAIEPFQPQIAADLSNLRWLIGQNEGAMALAQTLRVRDRAPALAMIYASLNRYHDAADVLMTMPESGGAQAAHLLAAAPVKGSPPSRLPALPARLQFVYLYAGAPERALDDYGRRVAIGYVSSNVMAFVWHPSYAEVRKTDRFKQLVRKAGLVDYWRAKGWPPQCHPTTGDDFECS